MQITLKHNDGNVLITELENGLKQVSVELFNKQAYIFRDSCLTSYPLYLIEKVLEIKGPYWLCDEIMRDQNSKTLENSIKYGLLSYIDKDLFKNKRILDFGSGSGSSTMVLARMLSEIELVGVELDDKSIELAELRAKYYGFGNVKFFRSPTGDSLPYNLGQFDYIILNAVYEHLLPDERQPILNLLWSCLKPNGVLFITETPHRYFFVEQHTTGLPFVVYMNDKWLFILSFVKKNM